MPATFGKEATVIESPGLSGIEEALRQCGVTEQTLTSAEKVAIDQDGYLVLANVLDRHRLTLLRAAFDLAVGQGHRSGVGCELDYNDAVFDGIAMHQRVLAAAYHALRRPFVVSGLRGRDPLPGFGQQ